MPTLDVSMMLTPIGPLDHPDGRRYDPRRWASPDDASILLERLPRELQSVARRPCADLGAVTDALRLYFCGELAALDDLPVEQAGGAFQQRAWIALRGVAPGAPDDVSVAGDRSWRRSTRARCRDGLRLEPDLPDCAVPSDHRLGW